MKNLFSFFCLVFLILSRYVNAQVADLQEQINTWEITYLETTNLDPVGKVCQKLQLMAKIDQTLREYLVQGVLDSKARDPEKLTFLCSMINFKRTSLSEDEDGLIEQYDRKHYEALKKILDEIQEGWPVISKYGKEADFHAWLICQHASFDREWQQKVLIPRLEGLLEKKEINPAGLAWLKDPSLDNLEAIEKVLIEQGEPWIGMIAKIKQMRQFFQVALPLLEK
ncbi:MAG: hypothetical protein JSS10_00260 [Verrucomicrobia bacterium]|nr:hypothetical protein [Verrucomicrobiota bacterium]